jgi:hypothetical protein
MFAPGRFRFITAYEQNGNMPMALQRWEYLGETTTSARLMAPATGGDIKAVPFHCTHFDTLFVEPIPTSE